MEAKNIKLESKQLAETRMVLKNQLVKILNRLNYKLGGLDFDFYEFSDQLEIGFGVYQNKIQIIRKNLDLKGRIKIEPIKNIYNLNDKEVIYLVNLLSQFFNDLLIEIRNRNNKLIDMKEKINNIELALNN